jgi:hypothetical protein
MGEKFARPGLIHDRHSFDRWFEAMSEKSPEPALVLHQFNRLMQELLHGTLKRNTFRPWEIELLLDIQECNLREKNRREVLRRYQRAVQREVDKGARSLMKLSEYLERQRSRRVPASRPDGERGLRIS